MNICVLDFEQILKNFKPYHESLVEIRDYRQQFSDKIERIKKEMETLISASKTLVLDESLQMKNATRFKELQAEGVKAESEFRSEIMERQNVALELSYTKLSELVEKYSEEKSISLVLNKSSVIFSNNSNDITIDILNFVKENDLFVETPDFND